MINVLMIRNLKFRIIKNDVDVSLIIKISG